MLLKVQNLSVSYGNIKAIHDISFEIPEGSLVSLIGANGAGKSTILKCISGLVSARDGKIIFNGVNITNLPPHQRVHRGITQSPEGRGIFAGMTVSENLDMGSYIMKYNRQTSKVEREKIYAIFPRLAERASQSAGTLSGGEQQMLAIGRALMGKPKILLLDEPSMGLAPKLIQQIFSIIDNIKESGVTILLVEQNAKQALKRSDYAYVLETGKIARQGRGVELLNDEAIQRLYLGIE